MSSRIGLLKLLPGKNCPGSRRGSEVQRSPHLQNQQCGRPGHQLPTRADELFLGYRTCPLCACTAPGSCPCPWLLSQHVWSLAKRRDGRAQCRGPGHQDKLRSGKQGSAGVVSWPVCALMLRSPLHAAVRCAFSEHCGMSSFLLCLSTGVMTGLTTAPGFPVIGRPCTPCRHGVGRARAGCVPGSPGWWLSAAAVARSSRLPGCVAHSYFREFVTAAGEEAELGQLCVFAPRGGGHSCVRNRGGKGARPYRKALPSSSRSHPHLCCDTAGTQHLPFRGQLTLWAGFSLAPSPLASGPTPPSLVTQPRGTVLSLPLTAPQEARDSQGPLSPAVQPAPQTLPAHRALTLCVTGVGFSGPQSGPPRDTAGEDPRQGPYEPQS